MEQEKSAFEELGSRKKMPEGDARAVYKFNNPDAIGGTREANPNDALTKSEQDDNMPRVREARAKLKDILERGKQAQ